MTELKDARVAIIKLMAEWHRVEAALELARQERDAARRERDAAREQLEYGNVELAKRANAARAEVARLTAALESIADILEADDKPVTAKQLRAALRQPAPAPAQE